MFKNSTLVVKVFSTTQIQDGGGTETPMEDCYVINLICSLGLKLPLIYLPDPTSIRLARN